MKSTRRLYQEDPYLRHCESKMSALLWDKNDILDRGGRDIPDTMCIALDRTLFFPEGGGQPADTGFIAFLENPEKKIPVLYVFEHDGQVWHQIPSEKKFQESGVAMLCCTLNWEARFSAMQRHCGEHILSAVFFQRYGAINRGFHMGEHFMTIDLSFEDLADFDEILDRDLPDIETDANRIVWENQPVITQHFSSKEEAATIPMRKKLTLDENVTLVGLGDLNLQAGTVACCGTHPSQTGDVGLIKIYKRENYKGMARITFDAGANALAHVQKESRQIQALCRRYSADIDTLPEKIAASEDKKNQLRQELYDLKKHYLAQRTDALQTALTAAPDDAPTVFIQHYPELKIDDLLTISRTLVLKKSLLLALVSPKETTIILLSDGTLDCGKLVKDNAAIWNGKGGGKAESARAMFPSIQDMDCFLEFLQKAYGASSQG